MTSYTAIRSELGIGSHEGAIAHKTVTRGPGVNMAAPRETDLGWDVGHVCQDRPY